MLNFYYKDFNSTAKESSEFPTGDFLGGDFWPDFGGLTSCLDKLCKSPKACQKIQTNLGKFGDLCPIMNVMLL